MTSCGRTQHWLPADAGWVLFRLAWYVLMDMDGVWDSPKVKTNYGQLYIFEVVLQKRYFSIGDQRLIWIVSSITSLVLYSPGVSSPRDGSRFPMYHHPIPSIQLPRISLHDHRRMWLVVDLIKPCDLVYHDSGNGPYHMWLQNCKSDTLSGQNRYSLKGGGRKKVKGGGWYVRLGIE